MSPLLSLDAEDQEDFFFTTVFVQSVNFILGFRRQDAGKRWILGRLGKLRSLGQIEAKFATVRLSLLAADEIACNRIDPKMIGCAFAAFKHQLIFMGRSLRLDRCLQKDKDQAESVRNKAQQRNQQLERENNTLKSYLQNIKPSENYLWVIIGFVDYAADAEGKCKSIGYSLPDQKAKDEFIAQVYSSRMQQSFKPEEIYLQGEGQTSGVGVALCMKAKNSGE